MLPTKKTALSTPPQSYNKNQSFVSHIVRKFHFRVLDANQFGLPVIYPEKFCRKWVQMRKYQACVFYMPILLRIYPSGSAHYLQTFRDKLRNPKEYQQILCTNPPQYAILISINKRTLVPTYTERKDYDNQSGNVNFLSVGFINCLSPCFLRIPCEIRGRKKYACQSN